MKSCQLAQAGTQTWVLLHALSNRLTVLSSLFARPVSFVAGSFLFVEWRAFPYHVALAAVFAEGSFAALAPPAILDGAAGIVGFHDWSRRNELPESCKPTSFSICLLLMFVVLMFVVVLIVRCVLIVLPPS